MNATLTRFRASAIAGLIVALLATVITVAGSSTTASAAPSGSTFQPGYIVSDANFFNYNSMTVGQIQAFLDAKGPTTCNGCLKQYRASTYDRAADPNRCSAALVGKTDISAAQMIYDVAQACRINPMTLLVTLQKETSLVTMSAPPEWRYQRAMGYGCPDSAPCSTSYYGLFIQLYSAASQLNYYGKGSFTWYPVGTWTAVRYSPNAACGSSAVYIQNRATAALYYYTPYQPNTAALTNLYTTGDSCSAYGNRNFWRTWWDWFGDPAGAVVTPTIPVVVSPSPSVTPTPVPSATASATSNTTTTSTTTTTAPTTTTATTSTTSTTTTTAPAPTTTTAPSPTTVVHTVAPGDTLSKIAARYKTTVAAIAAANPSIKNVNLIYVGQKFTITTGGGSAPAPVTTPSPNPTTTSPTTTTTTTTTALATTTTTAPATTTASATATTVTYTVVAGDTLAKIAAKYKTTVAAVASANGITNVNLIRVGQKLTIATTGTPTATTPPAAATTVTHTVVAGDTLYKIAAKYHSTIAAIALANKIKNVALIRVGQKLTIPAG